MLRYRFAVIIKLPIARSQLPRVKCSLGRCPRGGRVKLCFLLNSADIQPEIKSVPIYVYQNSLGTYAQWERERIYTHIVGVTLHRCICSA